MASIDEDGAASAALTPEHEPAVHFSRPYIRYVIGVLTIVYAVNLIDRQILSILMQPIKEEMQLSDTALGFLSGIAFALFYATLGIPIARLADKRSRVNIISISVALWSFMTALCGLAQNFWQLLAARILVGVGEAGSGPSSHSLIADYVPLETRSSALAVYSLGIPIGIMIGFAVGGWLEQLYGWRVAFMAVGVPGILLSVLVRLSLREPPRGHADGKSSAAKTEHPPLSEVASTMWKRKSFRHLVVAIGIQAIAGYGVLIWVPSFLHRSYHMTSGEVGTSLALILGIGGVIGTVGGGYLADHLAKTNIRWQLWIPGLGGLLAVPFSFGIYLSSTSFATLAWFVVPIIFANLYHGPVFAMAQALAPLKMRAMAAAMLLFMSSFIGMGLGPQLVGILSDLMHPYYGADSLRYALLCVSLAHIWSAAHFWLASKTLKEDLAL
ncbi:MAG: spinster family MFS transporter [Alphaproteobacteria bacterium]